jgi:hypothetical protein
LNQATGRQTRSPELLLIIHQRGHIGRRLMRNQFESDLVDLGVARSYM